MPDLSDWAPHLNHPLVLVGFALLLVATVVLALRKSVNGLLALAALVVIGGLILFALRPDDEGPGSVPSIELALFLQRSAEATIQWVSEGGAGAGAAGALLYLLWNVLQQTGPASTSSSTRSGGPLLSLDVKRPLHWVVYLLGGGLMGFAWVEFIKYENFQAFFVGMFWHHTASAWAMLGPIVRKWLADAAASDGSEPGGAT